MKCGHLEARESILFSKRHWKRELVLAGGSAGSLWLVRKWDYQTPDPLAMSVVEGLGSSSYVPPNSPAL